MRTSVSEAPPQLPPPQPLAYPSDDPNNVPPNKRIIRYRCPFTEILLIGVLRPLGRHLLFEFDPKLEQWSHHVCYCQTRATEMDLYPLYSIHLQPHQENVIFAYNTVTCQVEQYILNKMSGGMEQVDYKDLPYSRELTESVDTNMIAAVPIGDNNYIHITKDPVCRYLRKSASRDGQMRLYPPVPVKTLMVQKLESGTVDIINKTQTEKLPPEVPTEDLNYYNHVLKLPLAIFSTCRHKTKPESLTHMKISDGSYLTYIFNYQKGTFDIFKCDKCGDKTVVQEHHLVPKYAKKVDQNTWMVHVYNVFSRLMEQYVWRHGGFEQVYFPGLPYDPAEDSTCRTLFKTEIPTIVVSKDADGGMQKEIWCAKTCRFVEIPPAPVRTFVTEMKKRKLEEEMKQKEMEQKPTAPIPVPPLPLLPLVPQISQLNQQQFKLLLHLISKDGKPQLAELLNQHFPQNSS